ncbi:MAG TPA: MlaD family protein [Lautropia sp.]|nr:MlaD family protein [Lautropia sp.]
MPQPVVTKRRSWLPSLIWLIPIVAAVVGVTLVVRLLAERGPTITISFRTAEGIVPGKTRIKYKEVEIGNVRSLRLADDRSRVIATVELLREARSFTAADTRFWVVRPRAEVTGVSGLGTLLSGAYIGADAGESVETSREFKGLEVPPIVTRDDSGRQFVLRANDLGSLDIGSPVYYRRIRVGQLAAYTLEEDGKAVTLRIFINSPYEKFVGANTRFWHASGFDMQIDASGFRLRTQSLATVILGGIAFQAPQDNLGPPAPENMAFGLSGDEGTALAPNDGASRTVLMYFNQSLRGLSPGSPVDFRGVVVGQVKSIGVQFDSKEGEFRMPVLVEIYPDRLRRGVGLAETESAKAPKDRLEFMVERGLRSQLRIGNILTGQLYVALDFFPNAEPLENQAVTEPLRLPTVPNSIDELQSQIGEIALKLNKIPYEQIGNDVQKTVSTLERTLGSAEKLAKTLNNDISPQMTAAMKDVRRTLDTANKALETAGRTMSAAGRAVAEDAPLQQDLRHTLQELGRSAASLRVLTDYLEQHPESLLRGKRRDAR